MLALVKNNNFNSQHHEGSRIDIEGISIHGANNDWEGYEGYSLHTIQDAEPVPEGMIITATTVDLIDSRWTFVNALENMPVLTTEELRAAMPDKTPRQFRNALVDIGIDPKTVTAKIEEIPFDIERMKALNAWEVMTAASRVDPYIDMIGAMFDKTPEQIDEAWTMGA